MDLLKTAIQCKKYFDSRNNFILLHKHSDFNYEDLEILVNKRILIKSNNKYLEAPELNYFIEHNGKTKVEVFQQLNQLIQILSCSSVEKGLRSELEKTLIALISDTQGTNIENECSRLSSALNTISPAFPVIKELVFPLLTAFAIKKLNLN
ncbi:hypothetical protein [Fusobacterium ulcerans]|uniref:hypothetical protein n=1 Tax=Fusobacterium ulcerans TaxID=861 RepID=UPI00241D3352|nr:hypothetical protein [Fusobacterium ulcerans]